MFVRAGHIVFFLFCMNELFQVRMLKIQLQFSYEVASQVFIRGNNREEEEIIGKF